MISSSLQITSAISKLQFGPSMWMSVNFIQLAKTLGVVDQEKSLMSKVLLADFKMFQFDFLNFDVWKLEVEHGALAKFGVFSK